MSPLYRHSLFQHKRAPRRGITLIEVLIAIAISLTVLLALAVAFREMSKEISNGRAVMELSTQLRSATETLRQDLTNATVIPRPWTDASPQQGYLEAGEGPLRDNSIDVTDPIEFPFSMQGDVDDFLALTVRTTGKPYRGRFNGRIIESPVAEVVYWTQVNNTVVGNPIADNPAIVSYPAGEYLVLYRRVLLVRPDLNPSVTGAASIDVFYQENDVSVRDQGGSLVCNTLEDLTLLQNRFAHALPPDPNVLQLAEMNRTILANRVLILNNEGDDILLTDLTGYDLQVYSPNAEVLEYNVSNGPFDNNQHIIEPSDTGYVDLSSSLPAKYDGAFVDMGFAAGAADTWFEGVPQSLDYWGNNVWTNWSMHYERDGLDQDGIYGADQGVNGFDDDGFNGVDDTFERETYPPYPYPLRGVRFTIRVLDVKTKQMRQSTVTHSFLPK
jgi:type II secretory pathway component PulJ